MTNRTKVARSKRPTLMPQLTMRHLGTLLLLVIAALTSAHAGTPDPRLKNSTIFPKDGWTYVHLEGTPAEIGFQHGYLLSAEIEDNARVYQLEGRHDADHDWTFFRDAAQTQIWPHIEPEYQAELQGIADGLKARHSALDLWDVVAINAYEELADYYLPWLNHRNHHPNPPGAVPPGRCSAFIATGSATKDGQIVIAHSNWSSYVEGERWNIVFDIAPAAGHRILMDGTAGMITSGDDFGVNSAGLMIAETTLPRFEGWNPSGTPEFVRSRKAMQYAASIDEYVATMRDQNNGGYANSWLIGDRKTGEIAYLELGLQHTPLTRTKDGYFVSANFPVDPDLIRDDTPGFDPKDRSSSMNARRIRADQFMQQHTRQIDTTLAQTFLSDHLDPYENRIHADQRSLCGHEDTSGKGEHMWNTPPYYPGGAVSGKVMDSAMAEKMTFIARIGHPCGEPFLAAPFLHAHKEFRWEAPILHDMIAGPWTTFTTGQRKAKAAA
jgi:Phospholipase B